MATRPKFPVIPGSPVIPAKAGIQAGVRATWRRCVPWIPACAGMTGMAHRVADRLAVATPTSFATQSNRMAEFSAQNRPYHPFDRNGNVDSDSTGTRAMRFENPHSTATVVKSLNLGICQCAIPNGHLVDLPVNCEASAIGLVAFADQ